MTAQIEPVVAVRNLRVATTDGTEIIHGVEFDLYRGEVLGLVGESGSGKTTAGLACLAHYREGLQHAGGSIMITPVNGTEPFNLLDLDAETIRSLRGRRIAYVPQDPALSLNPAMRVGDQILEVLTIHKYGSSDAERRARVAEVLADVDLPNNDAYQRRWPHQLSGGQQQRIGIAMAFAMNPDVLVLDEPTTGLDVSTQAHVLETIRHMTVTHNVASLYITHDLAVVAALAHRVAVMYRGEVVETGDWEQILTRPEHPYTRRLIAAVPDLAGKKDLESTAELPRARTVQASDTSEDEPTVWDEKYLLEVQNLNVAYGDTTVLNNISLGIEPGQCTLLLGESGSGKTTLARSIAGLLHHYEGTVKLRGEQLATGTRKRNLAQRQDLQYIFQSPYASLNPRRTIGQSLSVPLDMSGILPKKQRRAVVEETLEAVQLDASFYNRRPGDLSGGERQRAAIARALVNAPSVIICDEITSALDVSVQASIIALLNYLRESRGLTMLFVTHNITLARHIATHIAVLNEGDLVEYGTVDKVLDNPTHEYTKSLLANIVELK